MEERKTPLMGWASWNAFRTDINENKILEQAELLNELGLSELGFNYVNIDDGYFGGRDESGKLKVRPDRFPNGLKPVVDAIHKKGLKAGIYSDAGHNTCASYFDKEGDNGRGVGLYQHEADDIELFFKDLGFDFLKVDWCGGLRLGIDEKEQYSKISNEIKKISKELDKDIIFNICRWQFPGEWVTEVADSWRIAGDIVPKFESVLYEFDSAKPFYQYHGPGHVNDLDMLDLGNGMSLNEDKTHFALWCLMSTPLMIGCDLTKIKPETLEILKNEDLIALNQDPACLPAYVIERDIDKNGAIIDEVLIKDLGKVGSNEKAIGLLNRSNKPIDLSLALEDAGLLGKIESIRELTEQVDLTPTDVIETELRPHQMKVYRVKAEKGEIKPNLDHQNEYIPYEYNNVALNELDQKIQDGALLFDVRMPDEYEKDHLEGAINIPYLNFHWIVEPFKEYKDKDIILTCSTGKRAEQVYQILKYNGFNKVSILRK